MNNPAIAYLRALDDVGQDTVAIQVSSLTALMEALEALREDESELEDQDANHPLPEALYCAACDVEFELGLGMAGLVKLTKQLPKRVTLPGEPDNRYQVFPI